jgi:hypothetical protein
VKRKYINNYIEIYLCGLPLFSSTKIVNWQRIDGKTKVGGVLFCVAGAMTMVLYKGLILITDNLYDSDLQGMVMAGKLALKLVGWLPILLVDASMDMWHVGVVCFMGNCFYLMAYIIY